MTNWEQYGAALHLALCCETKAMREPTREGAAAAAEEGSRECLAAYQLATSDEGKRLAEEHGARLTGLLDYLASDGPWPKARDPEARSRFSAAYDAGLEHSHDALREDSRKAASEIYGKAASRLAEAAVAAASPQGEQLATLSHKYAAQQVERVTDPQAWALPGEIAAFHRRLAEEDREEREKTAGRFITR